MTALASQENSNNNDDNINTPKKRKSLRPWLRLRNRHFLLLLCFLNAMISYGDRTNIAIAIIPMAEQYGWSLTTQGMILSSFFYGYVLTQLISGYLSYRFGGKPVLAVSCLLWSLFTILTPVASHNMSSLLACRVMLGLSEGFGFPAIMSMIPVFIPKEEHSRSIAFVLSGSYAGAVLANLVSPPVIKNPSLGWESVFYIFGSVGLVWLLPWLAFRPKDLHGKFSGMRLEEGQGSFVNGSGANLPSLIAAKSKFSKAKSSNDSFDDEFTKTKHSEDFGDDFELTELTPGPSQQEQTFVPSTTHVEGRWKEAPSGKGFFDIPWKLIFSKKEVWAIIIAQFCQSWSYWLLINWLPTYYKDVFGVDIMHVGYFTVVPYVVQGLCGLSAGFLSDYMINKLEMKKLLVRRLMQCGGMLGCAFFMLLASALARDIVEGEFFNLLILGMIYISVASGVYCLTFGGVSVNHLDIAPDYAAVVYGIGNTSGQIPGIIGVWLTGWILDFTGKNWNTVFSLSALVSAVGSVCWIFMSGDKVVVGNSYA
jgi:MFS family permease